MKLTDSEVLLLTQVLYHIKCSDGYFEFSEKIHYLHDKLCSYMLSHHENSDENQQNDEQQSSNEECVWHIENAEQQDEFDDSDMEKVSLKDVLDLEPIKVSYKDKRCLLVFEKGISKSCIDINLDDGDEILCDATHIERHSDRVEINCVAGWITFEIQKFPKSWTSLLQLGTSYKVS